MSSLWENIIGGIVATLVGAALIGLVAWWRNRKKQIAKEQLIVIMDEAIRHRNIGARGNFKDANAWINKAKALEIDAMETARKISPTAGSADWSLDQIPDYEKGNLVAGYTSILSKVIERIKEILERD